MLSRRFLGSVSSSWLTLQAVIGSYLMHHFFIFFLLEAVCAVRVEEVMGNTVTGVRMKGYHSQLSLSIKSTMQTNPSRTTVSNG